jgi:hypothetical protein
MDTPDHLTTPPPAEARAQLHEWIDVCDDEVLLAWWNLVCWLMRPVGGHEE